MDVFHVVYRIAALAHFAHGGVLFRIAHIKWERSGPASGIFIRVFIVYGAVLAPPQTKRRSGPRDLQSADDLSRSNTVFIENICVILYDS